MEEIIAKTLLTRNKNADYWFGNDYNVNFYRGCNHGCIYCDSRSECYRNDDFDTVKPKKDALLLFERELMKKRYKGIVGVGAMSDSYNALEEKLHITKGALELIAKYGFGVSLSTKSANVCRDLELFKEIQKRNNVIIQITITTADDELARKIEVNASSSSERFEAIRTLNEAGICAGVLMTPILPFVNDTIENTEKIVELAHKNKASFIYPLFGVTLRDRQRDYFYDKVSEIDVNLPAMYKRTFNERYLCNSLNEAELYRHFVRLCTEYAIPYKMKDIIMGYKKKITDNEQICLFP